MTFHSYKRLGLAASGALLAASLVACAAPGNNYPGNNYPGNNAYPSSNTAQGSYPSQQYGTEYGRVTNIYEHREQQRSGRTSGAGAILGAVVGGVLGNQVGGGSGRVAATAIGAVGGAVAGNAVEGRTGNNSNSGQADGYRVVITLDQGGQRDYDVANPGDLRVGDRVRLYNGQIARY